MGAHPETPMEAVLPGDDDVAGAHVAHGVKNEVAEGIESVIGGIESVIGGIESVIGGDGRCGRTCAAFAL